MLYVLITGYIALFWIMGVARPESALLLIFAAAPFQQDISLGGPFKFSLAELNLLLALPLLLVTGRPLRVGPIFLPVLIYLAVCLASSVFQWRPSTTISLLQTALYLLGMVLLFASSPVSAESLRLVCNGLIVVAVFLVGEMLWLRSNFVLGLHKNGIGASLCCAFIVNTELWFAERRTSWKRAYAAGMLIIAIGLVWTLSRGAWLGTTIGVLTLVLLRGRYRLLFNLAIIIVPMIVWAWFSLPKASREYAADLGAGAYNVNARIESADYAWNIFRETPFLGQGVGLRKEYDATNVILSILAETGVLGLVAFLAIFVVHFRFVNRTVRWLPQPMFEFSLVAISLALVAAKLGHGMVDHFWGRGTMTLATASIGMSAFAARAARQRLLRLWTEQREAGNPREPTATQTAPAA